MDFLARCDEQGVARYFLSNNSSRSVTQYLKKLEGFGIPAVEDDVLLSTHDLLAWLKKEAVTKTWLIGTEGMREMMEGVGISTRSSEPQYVVLGYDTELNYKKIATGSILPRWRAFGRQPPNMVCPRPTGVCQMLALTSPCSK